MVQTTTATTGGLSAFKRNERVRAGQGAKAAKIALENAHRRDMEAATVFQAKVRCALDQHDLGLIGATEALLDIRIAYGQVAP